VRYEGKLRIMERKRDRKTGRREREEGQGEETAQGE